MVPRLLLLGLFAFTSCATLDEASGPEAGVHASVPGLVGAEQAHVVSHGALGCALCSLYDESQAFVVRLVTPSGAGTGVVLTRMGLVITNAHVVGDHGQLEVFAVDGRRWVGRVEARDRTLDLALVRLDGVDASAGFRPPSLVEGAPARVGSDVYVVGHPLGLGWSLTRGIVSAHRRVGPDTELVQTDAAISPGNSGGPLLDGDGHVLGIVTSKAVGGGAENIAFAVPAPRVLEFLERSGVSVSGGPQTPAPERG